MTDHINRVINDAARPADIDILRCRQAIARRLADGELASAEELVTSVARDEGLGPPQDRHGAQLPSQSPELEDVVDLPAIQWVRWFLAGLWALGEMESRGVVIACETPQGATVPNLASSLVVGWQAPGVRSSTHIIHPIPKLSASHYRAITGSVGWLGDPDLFLADIDLPLDARTRRCVIEALDAWRRGLYLATVNMLGAAFEGAWMAAGTRLATSGSSIDKAVNAEPPKVASVQKAVAGLLDARGLRSQANELTAHAALLRDLRNYGVHPKPSTDERLERYLDEATSGLLILTTHHHLVGLADATSQVLARP